MVKIHYKKTENNQFLYDTTTAISIDQLIRELVESFNNIFLLILIKVNNLRLMVDKLACFVEDLANLGPLKPEILRGLTTPDTIESAKGMIMTEEEKKWQDPPELKPGFRKVEDKHGYRFGIIQNEQVTKTMLDQVLEAKKYISKNQVEVKVSLEQKELQAKIDGLRGAVMIAYPGYYGLPVWEPARLVLEGKFDFDNMSTESVEYLIENDTTLWWAGKELFRGKLLSDYVGKNEKSKIIVRLQKAGAGAPVREPAVDQETQKKMMAFYYKKQEEQKKLEEDNDDSYLNAEWANQKQLKNQLIGGSKQISWKPK